MEHIPEIIKTMAEYGISPVMLIFIGMIYMMGVQNGTFPKFWGSKENKEMVPPWAQNLIQHFNHDTTNQHDETHDKLNILLRMEEEEHDKHKELLQTVRDIKTNLDNIDKYGVKSRKL